MKFEVYFGVNVKGSLWKYIFCGFYVGHILESKNTAHRRDDLPHFSN